MAQQIKQKYSYKESKDALNARINAHGKYSDFNLHQWIKDNFQLKAGSKVLDLGCGNGNYTKIFWDFIQPDGQIIGLDKNETLIEEAIASHGNLPQERVKFQVHNFDDPFPELGSKFDWVFSIYSLYYTEDSLRIVEVLKDQLKTGGQFVVIGPGPQNASDLADFNWELTGVRPNREYVERIERIEKEFLPLFGRIFEKSNINYKAIDSVMLFPTAESYAAYYFSTMLWRESTAGCSEDEVLGLKKKAIGKLSSSLPVKIHKQISCLVGKV